LDGHSGTKLIAIMAVEPSRLQSATALSSSASFRHYGPANGGQRTFEKLRKPAFVPEHASGDDILTANSGGIKFYRVTA
jgi:hypothetical protein